MKRKIIITESQFTRLKELISESNFYSTNVKNIVDILNSSYTPTENYVRKGGEYSTKIMVKNNVDDELISIENCFKYLKTKIDLSDEFIKQVITDWVYGRIGDDYELTKLVPLK